MYTLAGGSRQFQSIISVLTESCQQKRVPRRQRLVFRSIRFDSKRRCWHFAQIPVRASEHQFSTVIAVKEVTNTTRPY